MYATADSMGCAVPSLNLREDARDYRANVRLLLMVNAGHAVPGDVYWFRSGDRRPMSQVREAEMKAERQALCRGEELAAWTMPVQMDTAPADMFACYGTDATGMGYSDEIESFGRVIERSSGYPLVIEYNHADGTRSVTYQSFTRNSAGTVVRDTFPADQAITVVGL